MSNGTAAILAVVVTLIIGQAVMGNLWTLKLESDEILQLIFSSKCLKTHSESFLLELCSEI